MKKKLPKLRNHKAAEDFVATADLTQYDLSKMVPVCFEFKPKTERHSSAMLSSPRSPC